MESFLNFKYTILSLGICHTVLMAGLLIPYFMVLLLLVLVSVKYEFDDGFMKKPMFLPCFGQQKVLSENTVVIDGTLFVIWWPNFIIALKLLSPRLFLSCLDSLM
jgi:hypothetical protein